MNVSKDFNHTIIQKMLSHKTSTEVFDSITFMILLLIDIRLVVAFIKRILQYFWIKQSKACKKEQENFELREIPLLEGNLYEDIEGAKTSYLEPTFLREPKKKEVERPNAKYMEENWVELIITLIFILLISTLLLLNVSGYPASKIIGWSIEKACEENRCLNGGTCKAEDKESIICLCPPGFNGSKCEHFIHRDECITEVCLNGGKCYSDLTNNKFNTKCICTDGYLGNNCELKKFESNIVETSSLQYMLLKLCQFSSVQKLDLVYRGTRDGFSSDAFHSKCDGKVNTLSIIKSEHDNIFGAFTTKAWHSYDGYLSDPDTFIFSLVNKDDRPFKVMAVKNGYNAIRCYSNFGPSFGGGDRLAGTKDIKIASYSNANKESYSDFGYTYKHPDYQYGTEKANKILAGSFYFKTTEIEVFTIN